MQEASCLALWLMTLQEEDERGQPTRLPKLYGKNSRYSFGDVFFNIKALSSSPSITFSFCYPHHTTSNHLFFFPRKPVFLFHFLCLFNIFISRTQFTLLVTYSSHHTLHPFSYNTYFCLSLHFKIQNEGHSRSPLRRYGSPGHCHLLPWNGRLWIQNIGFYYHFKHLWKHNYFGRRYESERWIDKLQRRRWRRRWCRRQCCWHRRQCLGGWRLRRNYWCQHRNRQHVRQCGRPEQQW